jgi:hypothetical protein
MPVSTVFIEVFLVSVVMFVSKKIVDMNGTSTGNTRQRAKSCTAWSDVPLLCGLFIARIEKRIDENGR